jgi:hypothetical protein
MRLMVKTVRRIGQAVPLGDPQQIHQRLIDQMLPSKCCQAMAAGDGCKR